MPGYVAAVVRGLALSICDRKPHLKPKSMKKPRSLNTRLGRLAPPSGALTPILPARTGKWVILKALLRKAFKITVQVVSTISNEQ